MSAANGRSAERRLRRRRRKLAAATSTVLLVAAAVAGEPISLAASAQVAGGVGGGLKGMTNPEDVGASGRANEDDAIGDYLLENAGDDDSLLKLGGDAPSGDQLGIPGIMRDAYENAADMLAVSQPNCHLDWALLASIGRIESNHARHGRVDTEGNTTPNILGPVLNGGGFAAIRDTDGGRYDGDSRWDRAVGAMQFIPSTWSAYTSDGNEDGVQSPHNVFDATVAAGKYLCSGGMDLSNPQDRAAAVFRYNHSDSYVATVLLWADAYANGATSMPDYYVPDEGDPAFAAGPPSTGSTPPLQTPTTNPQQPPPGSSNPQGGGPGPTGGQPTTSGSEHTVPPISTTTPCTPPPSSTTTTTTTTDPSPTTETSPPSETTTTTTDPSPTSETPPPC